MPLPFRISHKFCIQQGSWKSRMSYAIRHPITNITQRRLLTKQQSARALRFSSNVSKTGEDDAVYAVGMLGTIVVACGAIAYDKIIANEKRVKLERAQAFVREVSLHEQMQRMQTCPHKHIKRSDSLVYWTVENST